MKASFLNREPGILTVMVQGDTPRRVMELMDLAKPQGAEAFGIQMEQMKPEFRKREVYEELFAHADGKPIYVTNYRSSHNGGKSDEQLGEELVELASCGATLCDVMGDYYDPQPGELTMEKSAVEKQMRHIERLHEAGAEVLMSSHICKYTPAERVVEVALEQQRRGADIAKIVTGADTMEQQVENLRIIRLLQENLKIPFLLLSAGECRIIRRLGGELGSCMYLCVVEHDSLATPQQPLLRHLKTIRDLMRSEEV